jgi:hypothetical protein
MICRQFYIQLSSCKALQLSFLCIFWSPTCPKKTIHGQLEEKLPTGGSYSPGCQGNFHSFEITHQTIIFFKITQLEEGKYPPFANP